MYRRTPSVHAIISRLKGHGGLRGIVSHAEVRRLCGRIRELRQNPDNVLLEEDRNRLRFYSQLLRCFTVVEAERIDRLYMEFALPSKPSDIHPEVEKRDKSLYKPPKKFPVFLGQEV